MQFIKSLSIVIIAVLTGCQNASDDFKLQNPNIVLDSTVFARSSMVDFTGIERCDVPVGTVVVDNEFNKPQYDLFRSKVDENSLNSLLRLIAQQSNCFTITTINDQSTPTQIDTQMDRLSNDFKSNSNFQNGQRVVSDYFLSPRILYADERSKDGNAFGGRLGGLGGSIDQSMITGQNITTVQLSIFSIREGIQIAVAEGSATAPSLDEMLNAFGVSVDGPLRQLARTPEGRATAMAFLDAINYLIPVLNNYNLHANRCLSRYSDGDDFTNDPGPSTSNNCPIETISELFSID